jgi:hypothetical protein
MDEVGGVVHTHSTYATAWAARGEEIPCVLTMMADEFGGPVPVGPFAIIGDDSIGHGIVETLRGSRSRAVLMQNHGPFTIGKDARAAVKAAVMVEEVARTVHVSRQLGDRCRSPPSRSTPSTTATRTSTASRPPPPTTDPGGLTTMQNPFETREIWFLTGSQGLYGPETLDQVAEQSRVIAETLDAASDIPVKIVWKPVLTDRDAIRETALAANSDPACVGVIAWMHTFSPAKMWILGLDALPRRCCTCTPRRTRSCPGRASTWTS